MTIIKGESYKVGVINGKWWVIKNTHRHVQCVDEKEARFVIKEIEKNCLPTGCDSNHYIIAAINAGRK